MTLSRFIFISDLHLKDRQDPLTEKLRVFLRALIQRSDVSNLFLVGDIFDFWVADHLFFQQEFADVIDLLRSLQSQNGVQIHYFEGNHDLHLTQFWKNKMQFNVYQGPQSFEIDGIRLFVEHGDEINQDDRGYLFLRWFLRTPFLTWLAHHLPSAIVEWIGRKSSKASRTYTSEVKVIGQEQLLEKLHAHAETIYHETPFDFHIHGHVHLRDSYQLHQADAWSINLGTWINQPGYLEVCTEEKKHTWVKMA